MLDIRGRLLFSGHGATLHGFLLLYQSVTMTCCLSFYNLSSSSGYSQQKSFQTALLTRSEKRGERPGQDMEGGGEGGVGEVRRRRDQAGIWEDKERLGWDVKEGKGQSWV